jgi:hypothetical protein
MPVIKCSQCRNVVSEAWLVCPICEKTLQGKIVLDRDERLGCLPGFLVTLLAAAVMLYLAVYYTGWLDHYVRIATDGWARVQAYYPWLP